MSALPARHGRALGLHLYLSLCLAAVLCGCATSRPELAQVRALAAGTDALNAFSELSQRHVDTAPSIPHNLAVPSALPLTSRSPLTARHRTPAVWPSSVPSQRPVATSHTLIALSLEPLMSHPSTDTSAQTASVCPVRVRSTSSVALFHTRIDPSCSPPHTKPLP